MALLYYLVEKGGIGMKLSKSVSRLCCLTVALAISLLIGSTVHGEVLWYDDFEDGEVDPAYVKKSNPGEWIEEDGVVKQTNPAPGDHTYLIIERGFPEPHWVMVKVRIDDWGDNDLSRAGIGVRLQPGDGAGFAFLIHNSLNNMEFLNDHISWANNDTPPPFGQVEVGQWYWMKAEISDDAFNGKIWPVDEEEPDEWLLESAPNIGGVRAETGNVGLNGGSNTGSGLTLVSFDDFIVCSTPEECTVEGLTRFQAVDAAGKLSTTWGQMKTVY